MKTRLCILLTASLCLALGAERGDRLRFKTAASTVAVRAQIEKRLDANREHVVVEFDRAPTARDLDRLRAAGAVVLSAAPDTGVMVSRPSGGRLDVAGVRRVASLRPESKLSPRLFRRDAGTRFFVVELYSDVMGWEGRAIALREGLRIRERADLLRRHLLVEGSAEQVRRLTGWDEVAYVFPASPDLIAGAPVYACAGAVTAEGPVGQYIAAVGPGWDGYGRGPATLTYSYQRLSTRLPDDVVRAEIERAMEQWAEVVQVRFLPDGHSNARRNIDYLFARRNYGSGFPFDGPGRVLAHTFYPAPPNPEPIAGDVHFDDDETWNIGTRIDLFSVALHELGHALGLAHSDNPADVMYPYYRMTEKLAPGDIASVQQLYAAATEKPEPPPPPLAMTIDTPVDGASVDAGSVRIAGTASGGTAHWRVTWSSDRGYFGVALAAAQWEIPAVPLEYGANRITVTLADAEDATVSQVLSVVRPEPPPPPEPEPDPKPDPEPGVPPDPVPADPPVTPVDPPEAPPEDPEPPVPVDPNDVAAPAINILYPASTNSSTSAETVSIRGTAKDNVGVAIVTWSSSTGVRGTAEGTSFWDTGPVLLRRGANIIVIHAYDGNGNHSWRTVMLTRR